MKDSKKAAATVKQLSVFIENRPGKLLAILDIFRENNIQLLVTTVADTVDYGILRVICAEPQKAYEALLKSGVQVTMTDVFAVRLEDVPGKAAETVASFTRNGVNMAYFYSFLLDGRGVLIFRTDNSEAALDVIRKENLDTVEL